MSKGCRPFSGTSTKFLIVNQPSSGYGKKEGKTFYACIRRILSRWQKDPTNLGLLSIRPSFRLPILLSVQKWNWSSRLFACLSSNLSGSFLGISQLEIQRSVMGPSGVVLYRVKFFWENFLWAKITKNGLLGQLGH